MDDKRAAASGPSAIGEVWREPPRPADPSQALGPGPPPGPAPPLALALPLATNPNHRCGSASPGDAIRGRDFRPPKFNSPGGSRKPSAGEGRAGAPGVRRLRGEVPEGPGWGPTPAEYLPTTGARSPVSSGGGSEAPGVPGLRPAWRSGRLPGRGAAALLARKCQGAAGRGRAPPPATGSGRAWEVARGNWGRSVAALGTALPPESLPLVHSPVLFL